MRGGRVKLTIYIPNLRIDKGGKVEIREFYFSQGISRLFCDYFIPSVARDEIISKQSRNPEGKVKFLISTFLQDSILKFGIYVVLCRSKNLQDDI